MVASSTWNGLVCVIWHVNYLIAGGHSFQGSKSRPYIDDDRLNMVPSLLLG